MREKKANAFEILDKFSSKVFSAFFWLSFMKFLSIWAFVWGLVTLFFRVGLHSKSFPVLYGLFGIPILTALAVIESRKRMPAASRLLEILDRKYGCGGLLVASEELNIRSWTERLPSLSVPALSWKKNRYGLMLSAGIFFAFASALIPLRFSMISSSHFDVACEASHLADKIDVLREEGIISQEKSESLKQELENLAIQSSSEEPGKTLEAIDHLNELAKKTAEEAAGKALKRSEKLSAAEKLAEKLLNNDPALSAEGKEKAMKELSKFLKEAVQSPNFTESALSQKIMEALRSGEITHEQLKEVISYIQKEKEHLAVKLERLERKELINKKIAWFNKTLNTDKQTDKQKGSENSQKVNKHQKDGQSDAKDKVDGECSESRDGKNAGDGKNKRGETNNGEGEDSSEGKAANKGGMNGEGKNEVEGQNEEIYTFGDSNTGSPKKGEKFARLGTEIGTNTGENNSCDSEINSVLGTNIDSTLCGSPGTGGVSRGRGDAPLNFSGHTREEEMKFKEEALPLGDFSSWKEAASLGIAAGAPPIEKETISNVANKGNLLGQPIQGGSAFTRKILPRHRNAVKKYFERK